MRHPKLVGCLLILLLALPLKKVVVIYFHCFGIQVTSNMLKRKAVSTPTTSVVESQDAQKQLIVSPNAQEQECVTEHCTSQYESIPQEISTPPPRA